MATLRVHRGKVARQIQTVVCLLGLGAQNALAQNRVPPEFHGEWVPVKAACDSPARFRIAENRMTLVNGQDSTSFGDIDVTTTYFGHDYKGISLVSMPDYTRSSNSVDGPPFLVYFNSGEKKGVTTLEDMKAPLAKRFPLSKIPLRKCTSSGGAAASRPSPR